MKLMVTGAAGFLGSAVVRAALRAGFEVVAVTRRPDPERIVGLAGVTSVTLDLLDSARMKAVLLAEKPAILVHAAWSGLSGATRASAAQVDENLVPTCRLAEAAAEAGVSKLVGIGSQAEYGPLNRRITEDDLPRPNSMYGAAKLGACYMTGEIARQHGMEFAWLRLFATYGPGDNPRWLIPSIIAQLLSGARPRTSLGTQKWDYLFIDDAAEAVIACAKKVGGTGVFNLASGHALPVRKIVEELRDLIAPDMELVFGEMPFGPDQIMHLEGSVEKLHRATGWLPKIALSEGLARTVAAARG
jgi:nucleoside-diphosphate-sugar epimerase